MTGCDREVEEGCDVCNRPRSEMPGPKALLFLQLLITFITRPAVNVPAISNGFPRCFCCMPSETYGKNGVTQIFRSFPRTASSTTGGWSSWNIFSGLVHDLSLFGSLLKKYVCPALKY